MEDVIFETIKNILSKITFNKIEITTHAQSRMLQRKILNSDLSLLINKDNLKKYFDSFIEGELAITPITLQKYFVNKKTNIIAECLIINSDKILVKTVYNRGKFE